MSLTPEQIETMFTRSGGAFAFARWGRPIVPVIFGVEDTTLSVIKGAFEAVVASAGHKMAESDPEFGGNCMWFLFREWAELADVPDLGKMVADLPELIGRLSDAKANQYRVFRFDETGAIKACFVFLRMDKQMAKMSAEALALSQVAQSMLLWSDQAFRDRSPLAVVQGKTILHPDTVSIIRAAYDPVLPPATDQSTHALRLFGRVQTGL
jgi:hypothetical protein